MMECTRDVSQDWDHMLAGTLLPLIFQGDMPEVHCSPATIVGADAHRATELMKREGLQSYRGRRVCITSSEAWLMSSESLTWKTPSMKSKVTVLPQARSSLSGEGSPVTVLDQLQGMV